MSVRRVVACRNVSRDQKQSISRAIPRSVMSEERLGLLNEAVVSVISLWLPSDFSRYDRLLEQLLENDRRSACFFIHPLLVQTAFAHPDGAYVRETRIARDMLRRLGTVKDRFAFTTDPAPDSLANWVSFLAGELFLPGHPTALELSSATRCTLARTANLTTALAMAGSLELDENSL